MKQIRKIIEIDEDKCDGCGLCIGTCQENALALVNGKAKLIRDSCCDGLGNCLGECPRGAIRIVEREAEAFVEPAGGHAGVCPGTLARTLKKNGPTPGSAGNAAVSPPESELRQWPVQLHLVSPDAPYWAGADLLVCADCVPVACGGFQQQLLAGRRVVIACPKLDDRSGYREKLAAILRNNEIRSLTVAIMEVPCCGGLLQLVRQAVADSGRELPIRVQRITLEGALLPAP